jgi:hypothetical protein
VAKSFMLQQLYQLLFVHIRILHPIAHRRPPQNWFSTSSTSSTFFVTRL